MTAEALKVLEVAVPADIKIEQTRYDLGAERYLATGEVLPDSVLAEVRKHDVILLGAGGIPATTSSACASAPRARAGTVRLVQLRAGLLRRTGRSVSWTSGSSYRAAGLLLHQAGQVDFVAALGQGKTGTPIHGQRRGAPRLVEALAASVATEDSGPTADRVDVGLVARARKRPRRS